MAREIEKRLTHQVNNARDINALARSNVLNPGEILSHSGVEELIMSVSGSDITSCGYEGRESIAVTRYEETQGGIHESRAKPLGVFYGAGSRRKNDGGKRFRELEGSLKDAGIEPPESS